MWSGALAIQTSVSHAIFDAYLRKASRLRNAVIKTMSAVQLLASRFNSKRRTEEIGPELWTASMRNSQFFFGEYATTSGNSPCSSSKNLDRKSTRLNSSHR